jgi:RNA polymerase sigma factor (TIGR02999 family)
MVSGQLTSLLIRFGKGDRDAIDRLLPLVYDELHLLARRQRFGWRERPDAPGTTSLVHESFFRLVDQDQVEWECRAQFFAIAARAMRSILVDNARWHARAKRGGNPIPVPLESANLVSREQSAELIDLDRALVRLEHDEERLVRIVECRFFGGLSIPETAEAIGISEATVKRGWNVARAWLYGELRAG